MKILLIEDEEILSSSIARGLKNKGYIVDAAYDGNEALYLFDINSYDLLILDLNLPEVDGMEVLSRIREIDKDIRIIILSARSDVSDKVLGLDMGANDYLSKPFDFLELEARIRSLLLRSFTQSAGELIFLNLKIDTGCKKVFVDDTFVKLTKKEYGILEYLALNANKVVSAEDLMEHVWESDFDPFSNTFRYHISTLKKKLRQKSSVNYIKTIHGQGYILEVTEDE